MHDPFALIARDRDLARSARDPWANLCALATTSERGPEVRTLVLRDVDGRLAVFINATSPKHAQIARNPDVAVLIYLASQGVQYRLNGVLEPVAHTIVHANWRARPRIPKVMDWLYREHAPQSATIDSRAALESAHGHIDARLGDDPHAPDEATGHFLMPSVIERLELANDRIHDRQRYRLQAGVWIREVLVP